MAHNPVVWFEIYVQDMPRAKKFYETVFRAKLERINSPNIEMWSFPMQKDQSGSAGALVKMEGLPSGGNSTIVYFACEDCAIEEARAKQLGAKIQKSKMSIGEYGYISLLYDTEGNMIGLYSMK
jgi:predicted enzyme related to lactoylglutathione lyase